MTAATLLGKLPRFAKNLQRLTRSNGSAALLHYPMISVTLIDLKSVVPELSANEASVLSPGKAIGSVCGRIHDAIVDAFLYSVWKSPDFYVFQTGPTKIIFDDQTKQDQIPNFISRVKGFSSRQEDLDLSKVQTLLFPMNLNDVHWQLLVVDLNDTSYCCEFLVRL